MVHEGQLTEKFEVKTGVRQGCLLLPFLDLVVAVGRPGSLCGRSSASVTQPSTDAGKNIRPASHLSGSRTDAK